MAQVTTINSDYMSIINLNKNKVKKVIPCDLGSRGMDIKPN